MIIDKNKKKSVIKSLESLGFNDKEAKVYVALLSLGEVGTTKILKETGLHGQFVYTALGELEKKGLVQYVIVRGRRKYSAKNPKRIPEFIDQKKMRAVEVAAELDKLVTIPETSDFELFRGKEQFIANELRTIQGMPKGSVVRTVGGTKERYEEVMGNLMNEYDYHRSKRNIEVRYLGSEAQKDYMKKAGDNRECFKYRLLPGLFTGVVSTAIEPHAVRFVIYGNPIVSFTMASKEVVESYTGFFETLWKLAK